MILLLWCFSIDMSGGHITAYVKRPLKFPLSDLPARMQQCHPESDPVNHPMMQNFAFLQLIFTILFSRKNVYINPFGSAAAAVKALILPTSKYGFKKSKVIMVFFVFLANELVVVGKRKVNNMSNESMKNVCYDHFGKRAHYSISGGPS